MTGKPRLQHDEILAALRAFVVQWFRDGRDDGLLPDTPLVTSGIVDSAGVLEVVEFLEGRFGVKIDDTDVSLRNCNTLLALTNLVMRLGGRSPTA